MQYDLAIVGGGASGVCAALSALSEAPSASVILLEGGPRILKKVLATGNGRCNLSNASGTAGWHGGEKEKIDALLEQLSPDETLRLFRALGLRVKTEEDGRVYPVTGQAASVVDCLRFALEDTSCTVRCSFPVEKAKRETGGFSLSSGAEQIRAKRVLLACGGMASPTLRSPSPLTLAKQLGHSPSAVFPTLCPIRADDALIRACKGIRLDCSVSLTGDGKLLRQESGELQIADRALSGICIFQLSRLANEFLCFGTIGGQPYQGISLLLDLLPSLSLKELSQELSDRTEKRFSEQRLLTGLLPARVAAVLIKQAGTKPDALAAHIKQYRIDPSGIPSWNGAQAMAGGIPLSQVDEALQSTLVPGLFFAGELLDADGDCGGYNLQWAWSSGILSGQAAAQSAQS